MNRHTYGRKRRVDHKRIAIAVLMVSVIAAGAMVTRQVLITKNIKKAEQSIVDTKAQIEEIKEKLTAIEQEVESQKKQENELEEVLWRFDPVIIPDSMK